MTSISPTSKQKSATAQRMHASSPAAPLDYSFMGLTCLSEMLQHDPVSGKKKSNSTKSSTVEDHAGDGIDGTTTAAVTSPSKSSSSSAVSSVSLRVNNNAIQQLDDMDEALIAVFDDPSRLQWLDLSGNAITCIKPPTFTKYPNLFTLHLHGNQIARYADIDAIAACCPRLHSITLHGNPIEEKKHYRNYVIASFPTLMQLNFSSITRGDREKAETWAKIHKKSLKQGSTRLPGSHGPAGADSDGTY